MFVYLFLGLLGQPHVFLGGSRASHRQPLAVPVSPPGNGLGKLVSSKFALGHSAFLEKALVKGRDFRSPSRAFGNPHGFVEFQTWKAHPEHRHCPHIFG